MTYKQTLASRIPTDEDLRTYTGYGEYTPGGNDRPRQKPVSRLQVVTMSTVQRNPQEWLYKGMIPMGGESLDAATDALFAELVAFMPGERRGMLIGAIAEMKNLEALAAKRAIEFLNSGVLEKQVEAAMDKADDELREKLAST